MSEEIIITDEDLESTSNLDLMSPRSLNGNTLASWKPGQHTNTGKQSVDIILCIDTSGSMEADDYSPTRLEAAKEAARLFTTRKVTQNYNDRVGVIGFGGSPKVIHPLDSNLDSVAVSLSKLTITHTGTSLGTAIQLAQQELARYNTPRQAIVLLSDGGDEYDNSQPEKIASKQKSIKVFTIGIGTPKGARVQFLGKLVRLNEAILKSIAKTSGGTYLYAPDVTALQNIYLRLADF